MGIAKSTTFQLSCDKPECMVSIVEEVNDREQAAERAISRGWLVVLYPESAKTLCPRCKPVVQA